MQRRKVLGIGAASATMLVEDTEAKELRVLKRINISGWDPKESRATADALQQLCNVTGGGGGGGSRTSLIQVHSVNVQNAFVNVVTEYFVEGDLASELIRRGDAIPDVTCVAWCNQLAAALTVVHLMGTPHCSISTDRIFVGDGCVFLGLPVIPKIYLQRWQMAQSRRNVMGSGIDAKSFPPEVTDNTVSSEIGFAVDLYHLGRVFEDILRHRQGDSREMATPARMRLFSIAKGLLRADAKDRLVLEDVLDQLNGLSSLVRSASTTPEKPMRPTSSGSNSNTPNNRSSNSNHQHTTQQRRQTSPQPTAGQQLDMMTRPPRLDGTGSTTTTSVPQRSSPLQTPSNPATAGSTSSTTAPSTSQPHPGGVSPSSSPSGRRHTSPQVMTTADVQSRGGSRARGDLQSISSVAEDSPPQAMPSSQSNSPSPTPSPARQPQQSPTPQRQQQEVPPSKQHEEEEEEVEEEEPEVSRKSSSPAKQQDTYRRVATAPEAAAPPPPPAAAAAASSHHHHRTDRTAERRDSGGDAWRRKMMQHFEDIDDIQHQMDAGVGSPPSSTSPVAGHRNRRAATLRSRTASDPHPIPAADHPQQYQQHQHTVHRQQQQSDPSDQHGEAHQQHHHNHYQQQEEEQATTASATYARYSSAPSAPDPEDDPIQLDERQYSDDLLGATYGHPSPMMHRRTPAMQRSRTASGDDAFAATMGSGEFVSHTTMRTLAKSDRIRAIEENNAIRERKREEFSRQRQEKEAKQRQQREEMALRQKHHRQQMTQIKKARADGKLKEHLQRFSQMQSEGDVGQEGIQIFVKGAPPPHGTAAKDPAHHGHHHHHHDVQDIVRTPPGSKRPSFKRQSSDVVPSASSAIHMDDEDVIYASPPATTAASAGGGSALQTPSPDHTLHQDVRYDDDYDDVAPERPHSGGSGVESQGSFRTPPRPQPATNPSALAAAELKRAALAEALLKSPSLERPSSAVPVPTTAQPHPATSSGHFSRSTTSPSRAATYNDAPASASSSKQTSPEKKKAHGGGSKSVAASGNQKHNFEDLGTLSSIAILEWQIDTLHAGLKKLLMGNASLMAEVVDLIGKYSTDTALSHTVPVCNNEFADRVAGVVVDPATVDAVMPLVFQLVALEATLKLCEDLRERGTV